MSEFGDLIPEFVEESLEHLKNIEEDIIIIESPVGMPGRAIRNKFLDDVASGHKKPFKCPFHCIITCDFKEAPYCIAKALCNATEGKLSEGFVFAGQNAWRVNKIVHVSELMQSFEDEYDEVEKVEQKKLLKNRV